MGKSVKFAGLLLSFVLMAGTAVSVSGCASSSSDEGSSATAEASDSAATYSGSSDDATVSSATGTIDDAEALIGQEMTADDVEAAMGKANNITVSAEGCERGVMQGIFYYDGFTIFSRTYDKGNTFTIVSVSD